MPIDYRFPWRYEPKSRTVQDGASYVIAVLAGEAPLRGRRGELIANVALLCEALREISEGWLSSPEAAQRAYQALAVLERVAELEKL